MNLHVILKIDCFNYYEDPPCQLPELSTIILMTALLHLLGVLVLH